MRKTYMKPALQVAEAEAATMMALSIQGGNADSGEPVLTKEDSDWDLWGDDAE